MSRHRVLVVADTHLRDGQLHRMPDLVWQLADESDVILHAGDVTEGEVLDALEGRGPLHAVLGNNDRALVGELPETVEVDLGGVSFAMIHDSGPTKGRENRMHRRFPDADIVVFGHSHIPINTTTEHGQRLFNPGSAIQRRRQPACSIGWLEIGGGVVDSRIITL